MDINAMGSMQQMQMRKMDGTGMGQGNGGGNQQMREIMQQLPQSDRDAIREQMQSLDLAQRPDMLSQISQLDRSSMSVEEITSSIMDIINPKQEEENSGGWTGSSFSMYA